MILSQDSFINWILLIAIRTSLFWFFTIETNFFFVCFLLSLISLFVTFILLASFNRLSDKYFFKEDCFSILVTLLLIVFLKSNFLLFLPGTENDFLTSSIGFLLLAFRDLFFSFNCSCLSFLKINPTFDLTVW